MPLPNRVRFEVLKRDGFACHYCGARAPLARLEVDHIVPRSAGGSDELGNLISSCFPCNRGKFTDAFLDLVHAPTDEALARLFEVSPHAIAVIAQDLEDAHAIFQEVADGAPLDGLPIFVRAFA